MFHDGKSVFRAAKSFYAVSFATLRTSLYNLEEKALSTIGTFIAVNIAVIAAAAAVLWIVSTRQRLAALEDGIDEAMSRLKAQLDNCFNALAALADLTAGYDRRASDALREAIASGSGAAAEYAGGVMCCEGIIAEAMEWILLAAEQHPEIKQSGAFAKSMEASEAYENMARTSRLVYNDCVTKLNREIRMFPVSIVAGMLGFRQKAYLEEEQGGWYPPNFTKEWETR